ncbi:6-pyruvoyl trahydropterin synthase family protein [Sorangium sp. So ce341]|uniref:6-pyruvoyl trahydropterin synthase family protein n=1 Tax=Sorangium sp. So ce341 TaxID=3133302 RepID=UPI003F63FF0B
MYELTIERFLHVAHALQLYDGKYEPLHCHRWQVQAQVSAERLDAIGGVMDLNKFDRLLADAVGTLEGKTLNHLSEFADVNSSSERMAEVLYRKLAPRLPPGVRLDCVTLLRDEAIRARFTYRP